MGTRKKLANCNFHPRSDEVTQLGTAPTMAAARSAAAAPYPAPASHPPAGQPKRNILPRVAGLSRGQAPPQKVQKLTPLARPVPNKKALPHLQESKVKQLKTQLARPVPKKKASPHPQESPNPAVLSSANPSTSGKKKTAPINIHLKRKMEKLTIMNEQMRTDILSVINPGDHTDGHDGDDETSWTTSCESFTSISTSMQPYSDNWSSWTTSCDSFTSISTSMQPYSDNWSSWTTSCDSFTSISTSMQPCYCVNCKRKQNRQTVSQVGFRNVEHVSRVTPRLRFQSFGRFSNANGLPTMPCLSSDATATPSMGSCLSLNRTATPSMKSCLSPPSLSAQSTHSMVTCLTSDGHPMEPEIPENGIPDNGWTSPMVAAISPLPIPPQVPCGTQTEEPPSTSALGPRFKAKKWTTRLAGGRAKSSRKVRAALNEWTPMVEKLLLTAISSLPIPPQVPCGTQEEEPPPKVRAAPRVDESEWGMLKKILVATVQVFLFVGMSIALCIPDADCPSLRGQDL